jgi:tRNA threonylcarbamoyladenosine biosynthesis protein TsaE
MLILDNLEDTKTFAQQVSQTIKKGDIICLKGDLGSGKTSFTRFLIESLGGDITQVTSPTFNLLHLYDTKIGTIYHFDLYRLKSIEEAFEIGIEDALENGTTIIEWPDIIQPLLKQRNITTISFKILPNGEHSAEIAST